MSGYADAPWMYNSSNWKYYGPLLHEAKSYAEFAMMAVIRGYVNPDTNRRNDETLPLYCRHEPYEDFIYSAANYSVTRRNIWKKAQKFRDEMIELEIKNGERDHEGVIIPTKWEIENVKQTYEWCEKYHPNYFKIRGVK